MTDSTDISSDFSVVHPPTPSSRLIGLVYGPFEYSFPIPTSLHYHATRSRDRFLKVLNSEEEKEPLSRIEFLARHLLFVVEHESLWLDAPRSAHVDYVELLLSRFEVDCLQGKDIHTVAATIPGDAEQRQLVVKSFYSARAVAQRMTVSHGSALFSPSSKEKRVGLYAVFGGQGSTGNYLAELREVYSTYGAFVEPLILCASEVLQSLLHKVSVTTLRQYPQGLNVLQWMQNPHSTPSPDYLLSAPVSFPLIGLIQIANYAVMCRVLGKPPGELTERFIGMAGHSQGVVVAAAIATADSWTSLDIALKTALTILFFIGSRGQEISPRSTVPSSISQEAIESGDGFPTPMLNVSNCPKPQLQRYIDAVNKHLEIEQRIAVGLINGRSNIVVSGPVPSLCALNAILRQVKATAGLDQSRTAFSDRKPDFTSRFLPMSAAFHSEYLEEAYNLAAEDLEGIKINSRSLRTSVYHTKTGADLKNNGSEDIVPELIRMITCDLADWPKCTQFPNATHIIDFGPGATSGVGPLTYRNKEGTGVRVILMSVAEGTSTEFGYRSEIFDRDDHAVKYAANWQRDHGSKLVKTAAGDLQIENAMTRLLGLPPVMVAGMTPTTVWWDFVAAIINAGYHAELAGGGYQNAEQMSAAITKLHDSIPAGRGICLNVIYASPKAIQWQMPMIRRMRSEGIPIDGLTFGAGVPSLEVANEYIETLGLRYMAFKPGSTSAIEQVISIARANPTFLIMLQWTGGRGGGHHSFEDFHDPLFRHYGKIRRCRNVVLVAGSGFGGAEDTYPYLSGDWSRELGYPSMPFDGCLFGSRMMVAKEAHTSKAAKEAIVAAKGVENPKDWEKTYKGVAGGVITVRSEMGEPIHKLATRGVLLWREMDDKIFSITEKTKRLAELRKRKSSIVKKLNEDFQKVWFGRNDHDEVVDLQDMTYAEVLRRLVDLLYVRSESRWIDKSYIRLTADFIRRMQGRLKSNRDVSKYPKDFGLYKPFDALQMVLSAYPNAEKQVITFDDARYFILLCQRPGQKPVTFVPDLDENFEVWFKKDSLWQSEDIATVVGQDAGRTCILQGPVSARFSDRADEPVGNILGKINQAHVNWLLRDKYHGNPAEVPDINAIGDELAVEPTSLAHCQIIQEPGKTIYSIPHSMANTELPDIEAWFCLLAGRFGSWRHALFKSKDIIQGSKLQSNPVRRILSPIQGLTVEISHPDDPFRTTITVSESAAEESSVSNKKIDIRHGAEILVTLYADESAEGRPLPLTFHFTFQPEYVLHPVREVMSGRNDRLRKFYYRLWFGGGQVTTSNVISRARSLKLVRRFSGDLERSSSVMSLNTAISSLQDPELATPMDLHGPAFNISSPTTATFHGREIIINSPTIHEFAETFGESNKRISSRSDKTMAPLDFAIVVGWEAMMKAIFPKIIDGEFLKLVHLSNKFQVIDGAAPLSADDRIESSAEILSITNSDAGRIVEVGAVIERQGVPVLELTSQFLFRGTYKNFDICFRKKTEPYTQVALTSPAQVSVLRSKPWIKFVDSNAAKLLGQCLIFQLQSLTRFETATTWRSVETSGKVFVQVPSLKRHKLVATVQYKAEKSTSNPVIDYLQRHGSLVVETRPLENPQPLGEQDWLRVTAPASNQAYARASGDFNPIHVSPTFAKYANLPGTITHGMYTSAAVRQLVERAACLNGDVHMKSYSASFVSMVLPGDVLEVHVTHIAIKEGLRVLSFQAKNVATGEKVLVGEAEVDQPLTAYFFTGQGSQTPEMGMDLYATSEVAREVWDFSDKFFSDTYGFRISEIVKHNPKELTVHFGGRRGYKIRQNYLAMLDESGGVTERFFKTIDENTTSYSFHHKQGLLFSTQFAQPALTIMERAQYMYLKSKGLISESALFAGHSLGEYTALSTIGEIMPFEKLLSTVFYRGLTMQAAVERDAHGRSNFAMVAVNPSRISRSFSQEKFQLLVSLIREKSKELLEVVNYNIEGQQYVCAGTLTALDCLADTTNYISSHQAEFFTGFGSSVEDALASLVSRCVQQVSKKPQPVQLTRGLATIPLDGIDVPFHSSFLLPKMPAFRKLLQNHIAVESIDPQKLIGKYVSNVTGKPFEITREYFEEVYERTGSEVIKECLREMVGAASLFV